ncbi:type III-A CRISPR-associated RAMP protein Csm5 [Acidiplasma aeolicum]|jgi:CRISPR-associated protein Csm5|uniref:type III-A CRISPR-associated RAMP protein Csm5 n=1 Tax=Acidiplasma aeolicum TaxID=507754 RepID=UPI003710EB08
MKVKIKIISPLIINSTDYINISTVIKNESRHSINMLDMEKMFMNYSKRRNLTELFMQYFNSSNTDQIFNKLQDCYSGMPDIDNYKICPEIEYDELDIKTSNISLPIGNYRDNKYIPYIPGSSIKGAVRNALRNNYIIKHGIVTGLESRKDEKLDHSIFYMTADSYKQQITNDIMRFLEFTDFYPVNDYKLKIHKIVRTKSNSSAQKIPAYAVTLESGEFEGNITINKSLNYINNSKLNNVTDIFRNLGVNIIDIKDYDSNIKEILKITCNYYRSLLNSEKNYYNNITYENPMAIGFGGGIEQKTIITSLGDDDFCRIRHLIESGDKKIRFNGRMPSTHWEIDAHKFGIVDLGYY